MRHKFSVISALLFILCLYSCSKRKEFNPDDYASLLYKEPDTPLPPRPEYIFKADISGSKVETASWNTSGSAFVSGDTITITGILGEEVMTIKLKGFSQKTVFDIAAKNDTASLLVKVKTGPTSTAPVSYISTGNAQGKVTILKLDKVNNQIHARFEMTLVRSSDPDETVTISNGEFKINFSPNYMIWSQNNLYTLDANKVWVEKTGGNFNIYGVDSLRKRSVKIVIPEKGMIFGTQTFLCQMTNGLPEFYYTDTISTDPNSRYVNVKAFTSGSLRGWVNIQSITSNTIKGSFDAVKAGKNPKTNTNPNNYKFSLKGTFSAQY